MTKDATPLEVARVLAAEYGHVLPPVNYVRGVAISGRLRLHQLDATLPAPASSIAATVAPLVTPEAFEPLRTADGAVHAGYLWADELTDATGDDRYRRLLLDIADLYLVRRAEDGLPAPVDPDTRVEDLFCAGAILARAFRASDDTRYLEVLTDLLGRARAQPDSGLWWHCGASPFYWGRGNAFAGLGFSEALAVLPRDHEARPNLEARHRAHVEALIAHQDPSGAWRQVIDRPDSYLELTATSMIGYALVRGMAGGWLPSTFEDAAARAWSAVADRIDGAGMVRDACMGTGPLATLEEYLERPAVDGHDDRAGSMALWFAVEWARYTS